MFLGLNIDHCATVRQARYREAERDCGQIVEPDPVRMALAAEHAGADGITVHLREDRRHIQESDVRRLRECIQTRLNLEMACTPEMLAYALELKPDTACLVPESREEVTTEGGLAVAGQIERVGKVVETLLSANIPTSLFIDPEEAQIRAAADLKSPYIELHTGAYANAYYGDARNEEFLKLLDATALAQDLGLTVNAGHGINYINIHELRTIPGIHEMNIGHSIISRALFSGIEEAVQTMRHLMNTSDR